MIQKLSLKLNTDNFPNLIQKLGDLSSIEDVVKIKIDKEDLLIYSMISNESAVLALKSYLLKTKDYFINFDKEETYDFIITSSGKFVKNLRFFNTTQPIKFDITAKQSPDDEEVYHVRAGQFSNGKLKISCIGGEQHKIRDINKKTLEARLDPKKSKWSFKVTANDFSDIKKLSSINNEEKILNINVLNNKVFINEPAKWELEVDTIDYKNTQLIFGKKYLSNINQDEEFVNFLVFETFILIKDNKSNFMISFEQDFSADDDE